MKQPVRGLATMDDPYNNGLLAEVRDMAKLAQGFGALRYLTSYP